MAKRKVTTTNAEIDRALACARDLDQPRVLSATYHSRLRLLLLQLSDGHRRAIPAEDIEGLRDATSAQCSAIEILGNGTGLRWPRLDLDLYVPTLLEGLTGSLRWMAEMGRKGGSVSSAAKRQAAQRNGRLGGRPRKLPASA